MGWIKLHRSILDTYIFESNTPHSYREAWIDMIMLCNWEDTKVMIGHEAIVCHRGESIKSIKAWAKQFKWSVQKVRTFFNLLVNEKMIKVEGLKYSTKVVIINYASYQDDHSDSTRITDSESGSYNKQQQTDNELITNSKLTDNELITNSKLTDNELIYPIKNIKKENKEKKEKKEKKNNNTVSPQKSEISVTPDSLQIKPKNPVEEKRKKVAPKKEKTLIANLTTEFPKTPETRHLRLAVKIWNLLKETHGKRKPFMEATLEVWGDNCNKLVKSGYDLIEVYKTVEWMIENDPNSLPYFQSVEYLIKNKFANYERVLSKIEIANKPKAATREEANFNNRPSRRKVFR